MCNTLKRATIFCSPPYIYTQYYHLGSKAYKKNESLLQVWFDHVKRRWSHFTAGICNCSTQLVCKHVPYKPEIMILWSEQIFFMNFVPYTSILWCYTEYSCAQVIQYQKGTKTLTAVIIHGESVSGYGFTTNVLKFGVCQKISELQ